MPRRTSDRAQPPLGVNVRGHIEEMPGRRAPFRARVHWYDPETGERRRLSTSHETEEAAANWVTRMQQAAAGGLDLAAATMTLREYGELNMQLALRGLELKTTDPYLGGWKLRVVPALGHVPVRMITYGAVDRAVEGWIADGCSRSVVKNSLAVLVRVMEQAVRDGIIDRNPARITGWQRQYQQVQDELDDPRALALPDWNALVKLADALVARSAGQERIWREVVMFAACTGARIGEVSGCRVGDVDTKEWTWTVRRQTTPAPGGLIDKGTKGKRARVVPLIVEIRDLVERRIAETDGTRDARLFTGPRGGRITTAVLRDATYWDEVVTKLGYDHLRRHDLRHTALTWLADAGVPVHHLQKIAGHGSITTTQRYLHPDRRSVATAGELLSKHLSVPQGLRAV
ncbi:phage integrase family protein [Amycolatopsis sp. K13G38]|uniref:Phage integrase family protein n=1 Tax=Amycolatopsis acididurans TaxID=2724524 RepID=A0ABX1J1B9_9PSEU|nr:phage integrase family protein [Amycolatopsis acididurans]